MTTAEKLKHHFGDAPIRWVPQWALSKLRHRGGSFAGAIDGKATYYDEWYARVMSEVTVEKLAALGVNLVILPFSVGGPAEMEQEERATFGRMARLYHSAGIVILPYLQWQNILQEAGDLPDSEWAVNLDGSRRQYAPWRRTVCQSSPGFLDYMRGLTEDALARGADGLWIDNSYLAPCRCPRCERSFRAHLASHRGDLLDFLRLKDFSRVEIPPAFADRVLDPIQQAYIEFNCARCEGTLRTVKEHMERLDSRALFASNPALFRGRNTYLNGVDLVAQGHLHDLLYLENKACPEVLDGRLAGNFHGFLSLTDLDCAAVAGSWKPAADFDSTVRESHGGLPETRAEVERLVFEGPSCGQAAGMFWAVRACHHGLCKTPDELLRMYFEQPTLHDWMRSANAALDSVDLPKGLANASPIGIYRSKPSLAFAHPTAFPALEAAVELLHRNRQPFRMVFSEEPATLAACELLVLPETAFLSDREAAALTAFVQGGGRLLAIGDCGLFTEYGFLRRDYAIAEACGVSYFDRCREITFATRDRGAAAFVPARPPADAAAPARPGEPAWKRLEPGVLAAIDRLLEPAGGRPILLEAQGRTGLTLMADREQRIHIGLMRYDEDAAEQDLTLTLRRPLPPGGKPPVATWRHGEGKPLAVEVHSAVTGAGWTFQLPHFRRFGRLIVATGA